MFLVVDLPDFDLRCTVLHPSTDVKNDNRAVLRAYDHEPVVWRDGQLSLGNAVRARVELRLKARLTDRLPCANVPELHDVILSTRHHVALIRSESSASHLVQVSIWQRVDQLCLPIAHIPEAHILHVSRDHGCFRPREVNIVNADWTLGHDMLLCSDVPGTNCTIVRGRDETFLVVIKANAGDKIRMASVLLDSSGCLGAEELDFVLIY